MNEIKHNPPKKKKLDENFIAFSKLQANYLREIRARQQKEFNDALSDVFEELGVVDKLSQQGMGVNLRPDFSGVDVIPVEVDETSKD